MEEIQASKGIRADVALIRQGLSGSREKAKELIRAGAVMNDGKVVTKASEMVREDAVLTVLVPGERYVSRGGLKLEGAIDAFGIEAEGRVCLDAGASTGGFTDCLLQHGALRVYAVDVGTGQLHEKLRQDPRVISMENVNIRYMDPALIEPCDLVTADLSFISLTMVLNALRPCMKDGAHGVFLVKPQFEAGREHLNKHGIVKDPKVHRQVLRKVLNAAREAGLIPERLTASPIRGQEGNREYLLYVRTGTLEEDAPDEERMIARAVEQAMALQ